jgi:dCMP deaminase
MAKMKDKFISAYMDVAERFAKLSTAKRLQVGAIVIKDDRIISIGYNGMPSGWDNNCEESVVWKDGKQLSEPILVTKPEVLHAESNAIAKLARSGESGEGSTIFVTHQPCIECAKLIYQSGVKTVYYSKSYRLSNGLDFLEKSGVEVIKVGE